LYLISSSHQANFAVGRFGKLLTNFTHNTGFFKENVRYSVWICRDPISMILGTRW